MFDNLILEPHERLLKIRELYGLTQDDVRGKFTKSYISYIENGKRSFTKNSARIVAERITSNTKMNITPIDLMESKSDRANRLLKGKLQTYETDTNKLIEIEEILKNHTEILEDDVLFDTLKIVLDVYKSTDYDKFSKYVKFAIRRAVAVHDLENEVLFRNRNIALKIKLKEFKSALEDLEELESITKEPKHLAKIFFNKSLAYSNLDEYDACLGYLDKLDKFALPKKQLFDKELMMAKCFFKTGKISEALELYNKKLEEALKDDDTKNICIVYASIAYVLYSTDNIERSKEYLKLRFEINNDVAIVNHLILANKVHNDIAYLHRATTKVINGDEYWERELYIAYIQHYINNEDYDNADRIISRCFEKNIDIDKEIYKYNRKI